MTIVERRNLSWKKLQLHYKNTMKIKINKIQKRGKNTAKTLTLTDNTIEFD